MNTADLLAKFRQRVDDLEEPYLWSDEEVYGYMDESQKEFCRATDGIPDATTAAVVDISVVAGDTYLPLHPSILKIRGATRVDNSRLVEVVNYEDLAPGRRDYNGYDYTSLTYMGSPGPVCALVIGEEYNKCRVWPQSNEDMTIKLLVYRLPLKDILDEQPLEIRPEYHYNLLYWMLRNAYLKQDADTSDARRSQEAEQMARVWYDEVKREESKKRHKTRIVRYGGY